MAERWQQWMPFHIDRWRGSPSVQAMHPAAQMGYLNLLCSCWQSADCCVPSDPVDLATESRLGDDLWALYGPRILRKFVDVLGRWRNEVLFVEWEEARRVYEKRKSGALRTNSSRTADADRTHSPRNTDTQTLTGTETSTDTKAKPSRAKKLREEPTKTELAKSRHADFKAAILSYWQAKNPGVEMPWDAAEGRNLEIWLRSSPQTTREQFGLYLRHRFKSDVNHTERPSRWIGSITNFAAGPVDRFNKPLNGGNGNGTNRSSQTERVSPAAERGNKSRDGIREALARRLGCAVSDLDGRDAGELAEAGAARGDTGDVAGAMGGDRGKVRHGDVQGVVIDAATGAVDA